MNETHTPTKGVILAADAKQEWLLPWWWRHFSATNPHLPITFFDLGLSGSAKAWCKKKGSLLSFTPPKGLVIDTASVSEEKKAEWSKFYPGDFTASRNAWFFKPFIFQKSPYDHSLWLDVDCEVRENLDPLFKPIEEGFHLAIVKFAHEQWVAYNSGVVAFSKQGPHLDLWVENTHRYHQDYLGDENILLKTVQDYNLPIAFFPSRYNWPSLIDEKGDPPAIVHHLGEKGKQKLLRSWSLSS